ncbi:hypothetical protein [Limnofasciculus baicalensis]|uniref:Uncharacterized protein n=1 Tax=Limnofasciculus baicalensis BBK-W-15 TaxID=2699891 RepID=A0AAE3GSG4_9CYAN|nr:hypothetical protein [Limnofasciculus baicalensis]MCP2729865.1 hypothetical protein [Limnofasciculus baicalensis BBK-W-15]
MSHICRTINCIDNVSQLKVLNELGKHLQQLSYEAQSNNDNYYLQGVFWIIFEAFVEQLESEINELENNLELLHQELRAAEDEVMATREKSLA